MSDKPGISHDECLRDRLRDDPVLAAEYLLACVEEYLADEDRLFLKLGASTVKGALRDYQKKWPSVHEIILSEFIIQAGIDTVAKAIGMDPNRLQIIMEDGETITPELDADLTKYFGINNGVFLNIQRRS